LEIRATSFEATGFSRWCLIFFIANSTPFVVSVRKSHYLFPAKGKS